MPEYKFPKTLGACADRLFKVKNDRLATQKIVEKLAAEESLLKEHLIKTLPKSEASGVAGKLCRVTIGTKSVPQVNDWPALYAHIKKTGQFELLQRRLADTSIKERWDAGKSVPGVEHFTVTTVSISKL